MLVLRERRDFVEVSVQDLDADFQVTFLEGGGAPMDEAVQQQNLLGLLEPYTALWNAAQQGGPQGFMARTYMKTMAEKFNLPKDLHPDELDSKFAEEQESDQTSADDTQLQQAAEPQAPQAPPDLSDLAQLPPNEAIAALRDIFADDAEMKQVLDQLETLPPEQQSQMISQILSTETKVPLYSYRCGECGWEKTKFSESQIDHQKSIAANVAKRRNTDLLRPSINQTMPNT